MLSFVRQQFSDAFHNITPGTRWVGWLWLISMRRQGVRLLHCNHATKSDTLWSNLSSPYVLYSSCTPSECYSIYSWTTSQLLQITVPLYIYSRTLIRNHLRKSNAGWWIYKNFIVEYRPGKDNPADYFSRHPVKTLNQSSREEKLAEEHINFVTANALPKTVSLKEIVNASQDDIVIQETMRALRAGRWYEVIKDNPEHESELRRLYLLCNELRSAHESDLLLRGNRIIIPTSLRMRIIHIAHEGYQGLVRTKSLLRQKVWYSGIDALVQIVVGECPQCQLVTVENVREPLKMSKIPDGPWLELSCDLMDLPNGKYVLILVDDYSRYPLVEILNSATSRAVIQSLDNMLSMFGTLKKIRTDNGPCFISKEFKEFSKYIGFKHRKVTPRWRRANGEAERMVRTLKKTLRICRSENRSFTQALHHFLKNYRATPHPSTG